MNISFYISFVAVLFFSRASYSRVISHDFVVAWGTANPDGRLERPVIQINGQWPPPTIFADVGDNILINVVNRLRDQSTSLHFHGLFMNGTSHMDGTSHVSQCAIAPGTSFTYDFSIQQPGTYWYHSHTKSQYPDGLRGPIVIRDPESPYRGQYEEEIVLSVSDWYHLPSSTLIKNYDTAPGMMRHDPFPDSVLLNDTQNLKVLVRSETTYLVRLVNIGAIAGQSFWIENHTMTIVEVDGVYTQPAEARKINLAAGQRYGFLVTTKNSTWSNFAMVAELDMQPWRHQESPAPIVKGWLVYNESTELSSLGSDDGIFTFDEMSLVPLDRQPLLEHVDRSISIVIDMHRQADGITHWMFNSDAYQLPEIPSLYAALTTGQNATNAAVYGSASQPFILDHNEVVEIKIRNKHMTDHPIHLHGHNFQVLHRSAVKAGKDPVSKTDFALIPLRRDTLLIKDRGSAVLRFRADNPGVWLFHCHMEWHAHSGLVATIVEAPLQLQQQNKLAHLPIDTAKACISSPQADSSDQSMISVNETALPSDDKGFSWAFNKQRILPAILVLIPFLLITAGIAFWFFRRRHSVKSTEYTLVPITDQDDPSKEGNASI